MTLEDIYKQHADFVWRCLRRQDVPRQDAADAFQEVFLTVHRSLARFEGRASVRTWLFTICRSVARDRRQRAHQRHELPAADATLRDEADRFADAAARLEHNDRLAQLEVILSRMQPELRDVFVLFEVEDMTGDEIASALGIPAGTAYSRLQVARKSFKQGVEQLEADEGTSFVRRLAAGTGGK
jgi:RNA polymerase sigma-70 factor (ECF subfamily)